MTPKCRSGRIYSTLHIASIESPVGQAVINHGTGDEVTVNAPSGQLRLRVLEVIG